LWAGLLAAARQAKIGDFFNMYVVMRTRGRQYRVEPNQALVIDLLPNAEGDTIRFDEVLLVVADDGAVRVGKPLVAGVSVTAKVLGTYSPAKVLVWKYLPGRRYRRRHGHRQTYTRIQIESINV
jgi:large subunit ribosomal protein L21